MDIDKELEELFDDPLLNVTESEKRLFDIPDDMKLVIKRKQADYIAQYKPCADFEKYEHMFRDVHEDLRTGRRSIVKITKMTNLKAGRFYLVDGVLLYLESVGQLVKEQTTGSLNGRTRCILENGTETDILIQTLRKNVLGNGYGITCTEDEIDGGFFKADDVTSDDVSTGYIYVLKSLSADPTIAGIQNLYKIGFTINPVEQRIANAAKEPTYLMAPVEVVAQYKILNMNSHMFESLVHQILDCVQMNITVNDETGYAHHPKEWFVVPLSVIDAIIMKILDGTITNYTYNPETQCLEKVVKRTTSNFDLSGYKVLTLAIKKKYFDQIVSGEKKVEYRELKQSTLKKYTYIDESDGKRYLKWYDILRLGVGYDKNRETALVQVTNITYANGQVEFHLGNIIEHVKP